jgi:adenylate cyclase
MYIRGVMNTHGFKRRLTAILSADVVGYSRLMREDEDATIRAIKLFRGAITKLIQDFRGRVVDAPGDNILAEFTSVVDAVNCAVEIQRELAERNAELPEDRRMEFRIGINMGDVVEEGDRLYGDGINIAARMESLAQAGGICISGTVYDGVEKKLGLEYEYLGEKEVKNIETPVRVYRVLSYPGAAAHRVIKAKKTVGFAWRNAVVSVAAILILGAAAVLVWHYYLRPAAPPVEVASVEKMAFPLPDKPSIAVLPFVNMSGDPGQEYFSDGITEEIITGLSKVPDVFVIARNSTFTYKGKPVKVQQVSRELGVRYVLEGSVRKSGDRLRITAQLVDALTGKHLWAERYDRNLKDIFALQDEITIKILTALQVKLTGGQETRLYAKGTDNLDAYLKRLQATEYFLRLNKDDNIRARKMAEEAIALDPDYAAAYAMLGWTYAIDARIGWSKSKKHCLERAEELARKAIALDDTLPDPYRLLSFIHLTEGQFEEAIVEMKRAIAINPDATSYANLGMALVYACRPEEAIVSLKKAIRINPIPPSYYYLKLARAYRMTGKYEKALAECRKALSRSPENILARVETAATYSLSGREEEARTAAAEVLRIQPTFTVERYVKGLPFKNQSENERLANALRKAGLK